MINGVEWWNWGWGEEGAAHEAEVVTNRERAGEENTHRDGQQWRTNERWTVWIVPLPITAALSSLSRKNASSNVCCMCSFLINPACVVEH